MLYHHLWSRLLLAWMLLLGTDGLQCCPASNNFPSLNAAMRGFDPFVSNQFQRLDPGFRSQIFEPWEEHSDGRIRLNSFIDTVKENMECETQFVDTVLQNYIQYRDEMVSRFSFAMDADIETKFGLFDLNSTTSHNYKSQINTDEESMFKFFKQTGGEIFQSKLLCISHEVSISSFEKPVFTPAFEAAVQSLHAAARDPDSDFSNKTFINFINDYGTHFLRRTQMGSKLVFQKLFTSKEMDIEGHASTRDCVSRSARASVANGVASSTSALTAFSDASKDCGIPHQNKTYFRYNNIDLNKLLSVGPLPTTKLEEWREVVQGSPVPIRFELQKLTALFTTLQTDDSSQDAAGYARKWEANCGISEYLEAKISHYCEIFGGGACPTEAEGCGISDSCPSGTNCIDDSDSDSDTAQGYQRPVKYGRTILSGGVADGYKTLSEVFAMDTWALPSLPTAVWGPTLTVVGAILFSCGGRVGRPSTDTSNCFTLDMSLEPPSWSSYISLPTPMTQHTSISIGSHLWFVYNNHLYDLNTIKKSFKTYNLPFDVSSLHCAVGNTTHSYIIGAGTESKDIWVNTRPSSPDEWKLVASLNDRTTQHGCLWLNTTVFITGGDTTRSDAVVFDTDTNKVSKIGSLNQGRHGHGMMVLDGTPAVVGGWDGSRPLGSIETYDLQTMEWKLNDRKLRTPKRYFGLVQLHE